MKTFQLILIAAFIGFAILAVVLFATGGVNKGGTVEAPTVVVWGTLPQEQFTNFIRNQNSIDPKFVHATYVEKKSSSFDQDLLKAAADGNGPDMIIVGSDELWSKRNRITAIPVASYPDQTFKQNFVQAAQQLRVSDGYLGVPLLSNPLVMYWNRDLFAKANFAMPPKYWDEVSTEVPKLSVVDQALGISQSAVALGEFRNIKNAKEILASIFFQSGNQIASVFSDSQQYASDTLQVLIDKTQDGSNPQGALTFFGQFSDPAKSVYTWNRALQNSTDAFLTGSLAMYFGLASEADSLKARNPNLNFDVAAFPQSRSGKRPYVFTKMYVMAIAKNSNNKAETFNVMNVLTGQKVQQDLSKAFKLSTVRADLVQGDPGDANIAIYNVSTIHSKFWFDPSTTQTNDIFQDMVESSASGRNSVVQALNQAAGQLKNVIDGK